MKGYIIVDVTITDPAKYEDYKKLTPGTLKAYDGKFVVRGGKSETLEGDWNPQRIVVLEFPSFDRAKAWWSSDNYAPAKAIRQAASITKLLVIEGFE
jgi:uncharacterized protein (DUF1330 family)